MSNRLTHHPMFHDPAYPSSEALNDTQKKEIARLNGRLLRGEVDYEEVPCLCGENLFGIISTYDRYRIWQPVVICVKCGLIQSRPRMSPKTLEWFYGSDFYRHIYDGNKGVSPLSHHVFEKRVETSNRRRDAIRADVHDYDSIRSVGEIGCAGGWNLEVFRRDGKIVTGCDPSPGMTEIGRDHGLDLRTGHTASLLGSKFDLLILSHVVEHFSNPMIEVNAALDLLAPNGKIYIEVPDARAICLGALQGAHLYYFTPNTLTHFMAMIGLKPISSVRSHGGVHFSIIFTKDTSPSLVNLSSEYAAMRSRIRRFERREIAKDVLRKLGLFKIAQRLHGAILRRH